MTPIDTWLLAGQLAVDLVLVGLLGFFVWKARILVNTLTNAAAGTEWKTGKMAEAFTSAAVSIHEAFTSTAASIQLSANAAAATAVAVQTLTRDLRPVAHGQTDDQMHATIDISRMTDPADDSSSSA